LKASFEDGKIKIEWDSVEGAISYDLLVNGTLICDIDESPYYYDQISDESEYSVKVRAKFFEEDKTSSEYLEKNHVEMANDISSVDSQSDSCENEMLSEWSTEVSVTAVSVTVSSSAGTKVSGNISEDTFWSAEDSPYIISGDMEILQGVTLTIEAGAVITMKETTSSYGSIIVQGKLEATGTANNHIVFTGNKDPMFGGTTPGYWGGFKVRTTGQLNLDYTEIRYASSYAINNSGNLNISNSKISDTKGYGIYVSTSEMNVSIENNEIINNTRSGIRISNFNVGNLLLNDNTILNNGTESISINLTGYNPSNSINIFDNNTFDGRIGISGTVQQDLTLNKNVYNLAGELVIPDGITLSIEPGAIINQTASENTSIIVQGKLEAKGTADDTIVFTNYKDPMFGGTTPVYWDGLNVKNTGQLILDYTEIRYTGLNAINNNGFLEFTNSKIENTKGYGVKIYTQGKDVTIENNEMLETGKSGVYIYKLDGGSFNFSNNTISNSIKKSIEINLTNYIPGTEIGGIESNTFDGDVNIYGTFQRDFVLAKRTYTISNDLTIPKGINLVIEAGTILNEKFADNSLILVEGSLQARGTSESPIIFTDNSDSLVGKSNQFYWEGIKVGITGQFIMEYGEVRYAGTNGIYNMGSLEITNSKIINTQKDAIKLYCDQKNIRIENNKLTTSGSSGINFYKVKGGTLIFKNNEIQECGEQSIEVNLSNFKPDILTGGFEFNTLDDINIYGSLLQDFELYKNKYVISGNLTVPKGTKLTIDAGCIVKVKAITTLAITVEGELNSNGTLKEPVVFTGVGDTQYGGDKITYWSGFVVTSKGTLKLNYTNIRYPGLGSYNTVGTAITCQGTLEMNNSAIVNSKGNGIIFSTLIQPILKNNSFINNANYSVKNSRPTKITIDGTNNYWGSGAGPALYDKTTKTWSTDGGKISDGVDYTPFYKEPIFKEDAATVNIDCIDYITTPLESCQDETLKVTISNNTSETKNCYVEALCSWDNETWYSKGGKNISLSAGQQKNDVDFQYCLFLNGDLYTKVVLYDNSDDSQLCEYTKSSTDHVGVGIIEDYDWYKFSESDLSDITVEGYISEIGGYAGETTETVYAITKLSDEEIWRQYELNNGEWSETGVTYTTNPIEGTETKSLLKTSSSITNEQYMTLGFSRPSLKDIQQSIKNKKNELLNKFYRKMQINPAELSGEDKSMIACGLASSIDDNVYFGAAKSAFGYKDYDDNYYYLKAKSYGDAIFTAAYYTVTLGSAAEALRALKTAGVSGAMAIAASPTGVGTVALSVAAVSELAESAAMAGVSFMSYNMAERSKGIMKESVAKLKETIGYKVRSRVKGKVIAEKEAKEANQFWKEYYNTDGSTPPYEVGTKVYEIELSEKTTFVRVFEEETSSGGQWVMKAEDIQGLTSLQIKDKYALDFVPKYICDVELSDGTIIRGGKAGGISNWGNGGGIQFDLMGQSTGTFKNVRPLQ